VAPRAHPAGAVDTKAVLLNPSHRRPEDPGYDVLATSTGDVLLMMVVFVVVSGRVWHQGHTRHGAVAAETVMLNPNCRRAEDPGGDVLATSLGEMCC